MRVLKLFVGQELQLDADTLHVAQVYEQAEGIIDY